MLADVGRKVGQRDRRGEPARPTFNRMEPASRAGFVVIIPDGRELNATDSWGIVRQSRNEVAKAARGEPEPDVWDWVKAWLGG